MRKKDKQTVIKKKKTLKKAASSIQRRKRYFWLNVLPNDLWIKVTPGQTILKALQKVDINLEGDCGGLLKCGKCKVKVLTSIDFPHENEVHDLLDDKEIRKGFRLACSTEIHKDLTVYVGSTGPELEYFQILKAGETPLVTIDPLVHKRVLDLSSDNWTEGISVLEKIGHAMHDAYPDIEVGLDCLRTLPEIVKKKGPHYTAVMNENRLLALQEDADSHHNIGLVFDLGTSTLVGKLINLLDGHQLAAASSLNRQNRYGTDVIRRIQHIKEDPHGLKKLHEILIKDLDLIVKRLLHVSELEPENIFVAIAAGNTIMQHFLFSLNPASIAEAPFTPVLTDGLVVKAREVGLSLHPEAVIYLMPAKSGYIGGDLISVILASGAAEQDDDIILGLDLGTNGEIFLGNRRRLLTCSTAAGPALEGARISHGMIAKAGAIEGVRLVNREIRYSEIGNIKPLGICGSGLVDLVSVLLNCGIIDSEGVISPPVTGTYKFLGSRVIKRNGVYNFLVASPDESHDNRAIFLTQKDVRELQLAKAAVSAGIKTLMKDMDVRIEDIKHIYLAGALGNYVNPYSAMRIGLLPAVNPDMVKALGNAASTGASMALLSKDYWKMANELSRSIDHVELSTRSDFTEQFISGMDFPEKNPWERRSGTRKEYRQILRGLS